MNISWYPGHMAKSMRQMQEELKNIDMVFELVDARAPISSRNPEVERAVSGKPLCVIVNKADLISKETCGKCIEYFLKDTSAVPMIISATNVDRKVIIDSIYTACDDIIQKNKRRGIVNTKLRALIVGIPNVGKSTFINSMARKSSAKTADKPGVTRASQVIALDKNISLIDMPGLLWPKIEDDASAIKLALIGSISDEVFDNTEVVIWLLDMMKKRYIDKLRDAYNIDIDDDDDGISLFDKIATRCGCLLKGGITDENRTSKRILTDYRSGKIGRICLDDME